MSKLQLFRPREDFAPRDGYRLLPFRFAKLDDARYVVTNDVGEHVVLSKPDLLSFARHALAPGSDTYRALKARHFLFDDTSRSALDLMALKYRTRAFPIANLTALHMFVVTLRCDHSCHYCQVSRQTEDKVQFDMRREHADKALVFAFSSPSPEVKLEFQGGEPLLNFELIRYIVERAVVLNEQYGKHLQFVIASNLRPLDDEILAFAQQHQIFFSTSVDGPEELHTTHRPLRDGNSYQTTTDGIRRIRESLGPEFVSALMTTTPASLPRVTDIIDEYKRLGFHSIFLRSLSPYGFAIKTSLVRRYGVDDWIEFYKAGLQHIIDINAAGYFMREELTAILLEKMFAPAGTAYVDLQSPAGIGIGGIVYNYDGLVYASDEGRMLAEMGDQSYCLGSLDDVSFEDVMTSEQLVGTLEETLLESVPMCSDCAFLPYCGSDPVFHTATLKDRVGHKAFSKFCEKQMAVARHVISLLEDDPRARAVMRSWLRCS